MRNLLRAGCLFALTVLAGCGGDSTSSTQQPPSNQSAVTTPQQLPALTTTSTGLVEQTTPHGKTVQLQGHFEQAVMARRNADGTITTECHDEQHQAEAFVQGAANPGVQ